MLPTMTRATEEILRTVPDSPARGRARAGRAAMATGAERRAARPRWPGIVTASLLAVAARSARPRRCSSPRSARTRRTSTRCTDRSPTFRCSCSSSIFTSQPDPDRPRVDGGTDPRPLVLGALRQRPPRRAARHQTTRRNPMTTMLSEHRCERRACTRSHSVEQSGRSSRATNVSAWFGKRKVLERCSLAHGRAPRDGVDRPVRLRQVDVHPHPQPHARGRFPARRSPGGSSSTAPTSTAAQLSATQVRTRIGMVFQKPNPVPGDVDRRERARGAEALAHPAPSDRDALVEESLTRAGLVERGEGSPRTKAACRCRAVSNSDCASPARSRCGRRCC